MIHTMLTFIILLCITSFHVCHGDRESIETRVNALLSQMTVDEKIYQLISWKDLTPITYSYGVGQFKAVGNSPQEIISFHNSQQSKVINESRLNIPAAFRQETAHSAAPGATVFPTPIAQGCSWNTTLINEIASIIAQSARSVGIDILFSPVINLWTDPRFGRISEGFSSNPTLTAFYARAAVNGLQNDSGSGAMSYLSDKNGIALGKHFMGYGGGMGGLNAAPSDYSMRTLFEIYLKPWRAFANAGGRGAMASHQSVNRIPMHGNSYFINDIFRNRFGFDMGQIISDCGDIGVLQDYRIAVNRTQAGALGLNGGVDMDLVCSNPVANNSIYGAYLYLGDALKNGLINETTLNNSVSRILAGKFATGRFDNDTYVTDLDGWKNVFNTQRNIDIAYQAAVESIVILKANNNTYSLKSQYTNGNLKKLAIIGPNADCINSKSSPNKLCDTQLNYLGPYTNENSNITVPTIYQSFLDSDKYNTSISMTYTKGVDIQSSDTSDINKAVSLAIDSDATIVVLGDSDSTCGEWGDNNNLNPPGIQNSFLQTIIKNVKNNSITKNVTLVVVLISGRPYTFNTDEDYLGKNSFVLNNVDLLINSFRPGQMGGPAIRDVIMGDIENTGRLGQSWPKSVGDIGSGSQPFLQSIRGKWVSNNRGNADYDGRIYDSYQNEDSFVKETTEPLFEFGYGLSNSGCLPDGFVYSGLSINVVNNSKIQIDSSIVMNVKVNVINHCKDSATDVLQVYLVDPIMNGLNGTPLLVRYWKRLIGFEKFRLNAGESKSLSIDVRFDDVAVYIDDEFKKFELVHGTYTVRVGQSSRMDKLSKSVDL